MGEWVGGTRWKPETKRARRSFLCVCARVFLLESTAWYPFTLRGSLFNHFVDIQAQLVNYRIHSSSLRLPCLFHQAVTNPSVSEGSRESALEACGYMCEQLQEGDLEPQQTNEVKQNSRRGG